MESAFAITVQNFASMPVGIALVWAIMHALSQSFPDLNTKKKVIIQIVVSALYAVIASMLFLNGSPKELAQQGVVLFCAVCFSQVFGYETVKKLSMRHDNTPTNTPTPEPEPIVEPIVQPVAPAPVIIKPIPVEPVHVEPVVVPKQPIVPKYGDQGVPDGRV